MGGCCTDAYVGIDPGKRGGLAVLCDAGAWSSSLERLTNVDLCRALHGVVDGHARVFGLLELVNARPNAAGQKMGATSAFTFGESFGRLRMALTSTKVYADELDGGRQMKFGLVRPVEWQRAVGVGPKPRQWSKPQWKGHLKGRAQELFPSQSVTLATADALLIAEACRIKHR